MAPRETKYLKLDKISDEHEVKKVTKLFEEVISDTDVYEKEVEELFFVIKVEETTKNKKTVRLENMGNALARYSNYHLN